VLGHQVSPVIEGDLDPCRGLRDVRIGHHFNPVTQCDQVGSGAGRVRETLQCRGIDAGEHHRRGQPVAELGLQPGCGLREVAHLEPGRVGRQQDRADLSGPDGVVFTQAQQRLKCGVGAMATGVELVLDRLEQVAAGGRFDLAQFRPMGRGESLRTLDAVGARDEAERGQRRGLDTVGRRHAGMERFAHGAELRLQTGGASGGEAEGVAGRVDIEAEQAGTGGGGAKTAGGRRLVEAMTVVVGSECGAESAGDLDTDQVGGEQFAAGGTGLFGDGQRRRQHGHGRVADVTEMGVVVIEGMGEGAVGQRRGACRQPFVQTEYGRLGSSGLAFYQRADDAAGRFVHSGQGDGAPVKQ